MRLRVLDLFAGAGGAAAGYARAGFDVTGVDLVDQPRFPYPFVQVDAVALLGLLIESGGIRRYDLVHLSPPCQAACALVVGTHTVRPGPAAHQQLIPKLRPLLDAAGVPFVIEQPIGKAPIRTDVTLCGEMFGLGVLRHRNFELGGWSTGRPAHVPHRGRVRGWRHGASYDGPYVAAYGNGGGKATVAEMQQAMGIDWTDNRRELTEAIPPAYTQWLGAAFLAAHKERESACPSGTIPISKPRRRTTSSSKTRATASGAR